MHWRNVKKLDRLWPLTKLIIHESCPWCLRFPAFWSVAQITGQQPPPTTTTHQLTSLDNWQAHAFQSSGPPCKYYKKLLQDLTTGIHNNAFYQMNGIQSKRTHNKLWYPMIQGPWLTGSLRTTGSAVALSTLWLLVSLVLAHGTYKGNFYNGQTYALQQNQKLHKCCNRKTTLSATF
jgi:hypothetical protein